MNVTTILSACGFATLAAVSIAAQQQGEPQAFKFRTGVELINVTATVTDGNGRFVPGLDKEDFRVYQDDQLQQISHFSSDRVPVSLGIVLDTSGSMDGEKMAAARAALDRFLLDLLGPDDEVFLYRFDSSPELVHGWTTDRRKISAEIARLRPRGSTAMYDAVAEAIPLAQSGKHRKKAIVLISDGNDTSSRTAIVALQAQIRETEVLVYAIGIDSQADTFAAPPRRSWGGLLGALMQTRPRPFPFPRPGGGTRNPRPLPPRGGPRYPGMPGDPPPIIIPPSSSPRNRVLNDARVNVAALRDITDDSGGRTEIVRSVRDLDPATASIADELSKQYYLGYSATGTKDGRWHTIRVELRNGGYHVRARKGFIATP
ncbi:MAG: VWA domain-containing protein [Acidobacteria bacterium]|nr:VWA domain-containing protein [Acidobacteriota bacterium]